MNRISLKTINKHSKRIDAHNVEKAELLAKLENVKKLLDLDPLTKLYNRNFLNRIKEVEMGSALVMLDIDFFNEVNNTYGHPVGDQILEMMGRIILSNTHIEDIGVRYGGDEFLIIFKSCTPDKVDERCHEIAVDFQFASEKILEKPVTVSIGQYYASQLTQIDEATKVADKRLYDVKRKRHQL